jgi:hypothetical protein
MWEFSQTFLILRRTMRCPPSHPAAVQPAHAHTLPLTLREDPAPVYSASSRAHPATHAYLRRHRIATMVHLSTAIRTLRAEG